MSASAIGSVTSSYLTQNINNVNAASYNAGTSNVSGTGGRHHHGGGGKFLQDVTQALQSIGLNVPGARNGPTSGGSSASSAVGSSANGVSGNAQQALQTFLYDLHQALSGQQQSPVAAGGGANSNTSTQNPYGNFATNIQNLLGSINNNDSSSISGNNDMDSKLKIDFNKLVSVVGGSAASSTISPSSAVTPSLQSFLQHLQANAGNMSSSANGVGAIFSAKV